ncbi:hypothetical protein SAMN05216344_112117 [Polaromonas sp. OV174]|uniref:hypothetical protein n=1 Tax=Polaromonas sp. OV174 TaxID=1855300 RepID=UPI0008E83797|nr:hypothetical protein [Polaromonas sp. OV174]SFC26309.1 hypothetical protein SAMN05216344_112117 [Polaromonas sp. OV174]
MIEHTLEELDYSRWPNVVEEELSESKRCRYKLLKQAIEEACDGVKSSAICKKYQISRSGISYLLNRCTAVHRDGHLWGYRALVKGCRQADYKRQKESTQVDGADGYGLAGAFTRLLKQYPEIEEIIRRTVGKKEAGLNVSSLHLRIIKYLRRTGLTTKNYPLNTKLAGYVALTEHIKRLIEEGDNQLGRARYGPDVNAGLQAMSGKRGVLRPLFPLEIACYDEQEFPFIGTLVIENQGQEIDVPLSRGYFCPLVDQYSAVVLGYSLAISARFRALDLLKAYESFITPWHPRQLSIEGLKYAQGAGLPSGVVPQALGRHIAIISVDNHLSHLANAVVSHLRVRTGTIIRFGKVRHWISRQVVEGIFAELQRRGFIRLPSTTGSGPDDPAVDDPVGKAIKFRIRMEQLVDLIDVLVADHNAHPRLSLMSKTPNEVLATALADSPQFSVVPKFSEVFMNDPQVAVEIVIVTVRGSRESGRPPHVQLDNGTYTNDLLRQDWPMIGKKMKAHIKGDFRKIRVFRDNGTEYGVLGVTGHWARTFHTRETRKEINRLHKEKVINAQCEDPVTIFMEYLAKQASRNSQSKKPKITRQAGQLANALHEMPTPSYRYRTEDPEDAKEEPTMESRNRRAFFRGQNGDSR